MLELYVSPSVTAALALVAHMLGLLFHAIAYCSDNWCYFDLEGRHISLGLWRGCWESNGTWECSSQIFENGIFEEGYDWHIGARVLMTTILVSLFILEFVIIGYSCVLKLEPFRKRLVAIIMGLSIASGLCCAIVLHLMNAEPKKLPNGRLGWSYTLHTFSFIFIILTCVLIVIDIKFDDIIGSRCSKLSSKLRRKENKCPEEESKTFPPVLERHTNVSMTPDVTLNTAPFCGSISSVADNVSYASGSYCYIPDNYSYSDITISTDVISYSQEPGRFGLEVDV